MVPWYIESFVRLDTVAFIILYISESPMKCHTGNRPSITVYGINIGYDENTYDCLSHSNAPLAKRLIIFLTKLDAFDTLVHSWFTTFHMVIFISKSFQSFLKNIIQKPRVKKHVFSPLLSICHIDQISSCSGSITVALS